MSIISSGPTNPLAFQTSMVFIDGTNLLCRLRDHKLIWTAKASEYLGQYTSAPRRNIRSYFYTNPIKLEEFKDTHGPDSLAGFRVVLGDGVLLPDGNVKEKGVDALLVADLIYHAASRNVNHVVIVTHDSDFAYALKRVEDFGVTTTAVGLLAEMSPRLRSGADHVISLDKDFLLSNGWVRHAK